MIDLKKVCMRAERDAETYGYRLNPDPDFLNDLIEGLMKNEERYGYPSCPCRLATGIFEIDRDIICPCDYRDLDVEEYGCCYCALYVRKDAFEGKVPISRFQSADLQQNKPGPTMKHWKLHLSKHPEWLLPKMKPTRPA